jgi:RNA polymerase sigma factor (sigma-70 family)
MFDADISMLSGNNGTEIHRRVGLAAEVFGKYGDEIRAIICFNVKDRSKAEDVFQDFFVSLVRAPIPPHIEDVKTYLYRAVTNEVIDSSRQARNLQEGIESYAEYRRYNTIEEDPQNSVIEAEEAGRMFHLIESRLSKQQAAVVVQRYGNGLSTTDTARRLRVGKRSVSRYLSMARKRMRKFIPENRSDTK